MAQLAGGAYPTCLTLLTLPAVLTAIDSAGPYPLRISSRGVGVVSSLAYDPRDEVADMQRRTAVRSLRPYPLGLRFSGANMNPCPFWLAGAQHCALNMSNNDLSVQLHHALFTGTSGYACPVRPPRHTCMSHHAPPTPCATHTMCHSILPCWTGAC